ncbi:MAG: hypothetical protein OEO19_19920 [Gammaproteobacteria bacterium]|nr:hypothetical protein [Gammaproteobacteria bacterium]MDH3449759.1 hypothetical protein [Gammaproteobacteria bacterium]
MNDAIAPSSSIRGHISCQLQWASVSLRGNQTSRNWIFPAQLGQKTRIEIAGGGVDPSGSGDVFAMVSPISRRAGCRRYPVAKKYQ